jgi:hypothetical protein
VKDQLDKMLDRFASWNVEGTQSNTLAIKAHTIAAPHYKNHNSIWKVTKIKPLAGQVAIACAVEPIRIKRQHRSSRDLDFQLDTLFIPNKLGPNSIKDGHTKRKPAMMEEQRCTLKNKKMEIPNTFQVMRSNQVLVTNLNDTLNELNGIETLIATLEVISRKLKLSLKKPS